MAAAEATVVEAATVEAEDTEAAAVTLEVEATAAAVAATLEEEATAAAVMPAEATVEAEAARAAVVARTLRVAAVPSKSFLHFFEITLMQVGLGGLGPAPGARPRPGTGWPARSLEDHHLEPAHQRASEHPRGRDAGLRQRGQEVRRLLLCPLILYC